MDDNGLLEVPGNIALPVGAGQIAGGDPTLNVVPAYILQELLKDQLSQAGTLYTAELAGQI